MANGELGSTRRSIRHRTLRRLENRFWGFDSVTEADASNGSDLMVENCRLWVETRFTLPTNKNCRTVSTNNNNKQQIKSLNFCSETGYRGRYLVPSAMKGETLDEIRTLRTLKLGIIKSDGRRRQAI